MATKKAAAAIEEDPTIHGVETTTAFRALWDVLGDYAPVVMGEPEGPPRLENTGRTVQRFARGWYIEIDGSAEALGFAAAPHLMQ